MIKNDRKENIVWPNKDYIYISPLWEHCKYMLLKLNTELSQGINSVFITIILTHLPSGITQLQYSQSHDNCSLITEI